MAALIESGRAPATDGHSFSTRKALRILVVDDDDLFRLAVRALLETDRRLSVVGEAADGEQAIKAATELSPDVILMDLDMPGMDGFEAISHLAQHKPSTPVIVLTGANEPNSLERAQTAGAVRYLLKSQIADICGLVVAVGRHPPDSASTPRSSLA
jgi:DNA-binding NarL/FixJ family response regulator